MDKVPQALLRKLYPSLTRFIGRVRVSRLKFAEESSQKPEAEKPKKEPEDNNPFKGLFGDGKTSPKENAILVGLAVSFGIGAYYLYKATKKKVVISNNEFLSTIQEYPVTVVRFYRRGNLKRVIAYDSTGNEVCSTLTDNSAVLQEQINTIQKEKDSSAKIVIQESKELNPFELMFALNILASIGCILLLKRSFLSMFRTMVKSSGTKIMSSRTQSRAVEYGPENKVNVTFKDVAGLEGPKEEIQEVVEFLRSPERFHKLGAKIPRGALLVGPPGTGKTLLAKACAGEANVAFFAVSGSEFVEMYVGLGAARVRDLFKRAKAKSPAIIFIDEIDAIGQERSNVGSNSERENTLNQLFVEMDGFDTDTNVVILAATNRKQSLDPALVRPGRFDRMIEINLPSVKEREEIFGVHLRKLAIGIEHSKEEIAKRMAALTNGMSGAEIMAICNEAALAAAKVGKEAIELKDFYEAYDRIFTGLKRKLPLKSVDRKWIAYREAGRTVTGWFLKNAQQVLKVSIIPRSKGSLGHTVTAIKEVQLNTKKQLYDMLKVIYGGRAAEEVLLGTVTTGAATDLMRATQLARMYVGTFDNNFTDQIERQQQKSSPHIQQVIVVIVFRCLIKKCLDCARGLMKK
jgi:ATP-dependent metalloprotease FtsH